MAPTTRSPRLRKFDPKRNIVPDPLDLRDRPYTPVSRERSVSAALRAYASMATSASDGAYRLVPE